MKIAHIDTERGWRGGQQQVLSLIEGLKARGHGGLAVVRAGGELERRLQGVIPTVGFSSHPWSPFAAFSLCRRFGAEGIDVVHAHTGNAVAIAALSTLSSGLPSVATRRVDFSIGKNPLSRWKYGRQTRLVAISEGVRAVLGQDGIPAERISLVPSGVDFRRFENLPAVRREDLRVRRDALLVGQVAALAPHKDQANFLRAVAKLRERHPNVSAVIVGDGELRGELEALAAELRIDGAVTFLGHRNDALAVLKTFDVFCLSSWGEGLGTSIIDAMALEVPVAATRVGGIPDLIHDGETGWLAPPRDPSALAEAIDRALSAPNRREIVAAARERAKEFSIDRTVDGMERVYGALIKEAAAR